MHQQSQIASHRHYGEYDHVLGLVFVFDLPVAGGGTAWKCYELGLDVEFLGLWKGREPVCELTLVGWVAAAAEDRKYNHVSDC